MSRVAEVLPFALLYPIPSCDRTRIHPFPDEHLHVSIGSGSGHEYSGHVTFLLALCLQGELLFLGLACVPLWQIASHSLPKWLYQRTSSAGMSEGPLGSLCAVSLFHFGSSDECNLHFFDG